jgi:hypothetical protein
VKITGGCLCGSIRYEAESEIRSVSICHCTDCQRQTGTASSLTVEVDDSSLMISGDTLGKFTTVGEVHMTNSNRFFCTMCGSPIVSRIDALPSSAFIKGGTIDDTSWIKPTEEIWRRSAQLWAEPLKGLKQHEKDPE